MPKYAACRDVGVESVQGWILHAKGFFPCHLAEENTGIHVDKGPCPDQAQSHDTQAEGLIGMFTVNNCYSVSFSITYKYAQ